MPQNAINRLPAMSLTNRVERPEATQLLLAWFEEDLAALRNQRADLESRISRLEQRIRVLQGAGVSAADIQDGDVRASQPMPVVPTVDENAPATSNGAPKRSIISLGLQTRTYNALTNAGINSFAQLISMSVPELRAIPGFGAGCVTDLESALARVDVSLPKKSTQDAARPQVALRESARASAYEAETGEAERGDAASADAVVGNDVKLNSGKPKTELPAAQEELVALAYRFGVIRLDDGRDSSDVSQLSMIEAVKGDSRWSAIGGGWYLRSDIGQSWIARRVIEIVSAVRTVAIEPLFQAIKRTAASKFLEHGCHMPTRSLLARIVQQLVVEGIRFDIVREIASVDGTTDQREFSGATQAILKAFGPHHRAITTAEMMPHFVNAGLTEASASVAISTSPIVQRLERGIYGLVGRTADLRDIAQARLRREAANIVPTVEGQANT